MRLQAKILSTAVAAMAMGGCASTQEPAQPGGDPALEALADAADSISVAARL